MNFLYCIRLREAWYLRLAAKRVIAFGPHSTRHTMPTIRRDRGAFEGQPAYLWEAPSERH